MSILEELGENQDHDDFDIEGFCEMMQAFVQEFETIPQVEVATWMFELEARLRELRNHGNFCLKPLGSYLYFLVFINFMFLYSQ